MDVNWDATNNLEDTDESPTSIIYSSLRHEFPRYYDRRGRPISMEVWARLFENPEYRRVAATKFKRKWVSTVWLGLDHRWSASGPPLIFETMVFSQDGPYFEQQSGRERWKLTPDLEMARCATEAEARALHAALVRRWRLNRRQRRKSLNKEAGRDTQRTNRARQRAARVCPTRSSDRRAPEPTTGTRGLNQNPETLT